jgi:probable 2-oxoglutarate dehydrogenase E1 component DHKTD1
VNLLTDILQFSPTRLFHKIKGNAEYPISTPGFGDVISHLGTSVNIKYGDSSCNISLLHNPSHLEAVNPVAAGKTRAKQMDLLASSTCDIGDKAMCVQLHGDASFSGQGVVTETLTLGNLAHYSCGGSIHVIVNNQVGYTTTGENSRSTRYASDAAKMIDAPIIHVNGDWPEDVVRAMRIAYEYRMTFKKDVSLLFKLIIGRD